MKFLTVFLLAISINTISIDINVVRDAFKEATQDKTKATEFYELLVTVTKEDPVPLVAYKGASIALHAKQSKKVKDKKKLFLEGVSYIEFAIKKEPDAIEPRFVRLTIQENTPKLLKYKRNIEEDKTFIFEQFKNIKSSNLKHHIKSYILQSKAFSDEEKEVILRS